MDTAATFLTIAAVGIVMLAVLRLYNRLIARRNAVDNAFGTIDVQLKLRCDLVPRIVEAVRGYMEYERGTLEQLTALRARATSSGIDAGTRLALDAQMGSLMSRVFALAEQYPDLKSAGSVLMLQRTLNEVEAQIAAARRTYNAAVTDYNTQIESFPANLGAPLLGFGRRALFEAAAAEREPVPVTGLVAD
jgi:LemA protein